jgi:hypothetical protein
VHSGVLISPKLAINVKVDSSQCGANRHGCETIAIGSATGLPFGRFGRLFQELRLREERSAENFKYGFRTVYPSRSSDMHL